MDKVRMYEKKFAIREMMGEIRGNRGILIESPLFKKEWGELTPRLEDIILKTINILAKHKRVCVSVSGGSDSDIEIDLVENCCTNWNEITYVFFDTGLEYQATKDHLDYLEKKYNITIIRVKAYKPIPISVKEKGMPFISKWVSEMMERLQRHNFKWEDKSFDELYKEYPKCRCALRWWCNTHLQNSKCIKYNKWLKEYLIEIKPTKEENPVSGYCCEGAKKKPAKIFMKQNDFHLRITGVRQSEGGVKSTNYKNCFSGIGEKKDFADYRPLFYCKDEDKTDYKKIFKTLNSDCYEIWGMKRTGCSGCPFGLKYREELELMKKHEPKIFKAVNHVFGKAFNLKD